MCVEVGWPENKTAIGSGGLSMCKLTHFIVVEPLFLEVKKFSSGIFCIAE
jgi:hypothetical protein